MSQPENVIQNIDNNQLIKERNLNIVQDFNNKRANSHATIFVASMFALFSVLSLAQRIISKSPLPSSLFWNNLVIFLCITSYIAIWLFGLYSLLNFCFFATVAFRAENLLVEDFERELISEYKLAWKGIFKWFASFKVPDKPQGLIRRNTQAIGAFVYSIIGVLPLIAFVVWLLSP